MRGSTQLALGLVLLSAVLGVAVVGLVSWFTSTEPKLVVLGLGLVGYAYCWILWYRLWNWKESD